MNIETDFLVVGSGIAGLSFALKAAEYGKVMIVTKGELGECNTDYAQGGIASVMYDPDTFEKHIHDTLVCGAGICDRAAVEQVVTHAPTVIKQLIHWGAKFDKDGSGRYELAQRAPHPAPQRHHRPRDRTRADAPRQAPPQHRNLRASFRGRHPDAAPPGQVGQKKHAGHHLLRRLRAESEKA